MTPLTSEEVQAKLSQAVARLCEAMSLEAIYLYGSYAYGTPSPDSDLDLLVVVADSTEDPYTRDARAYCALAGLGIAKDVQGYTRQEFEERAAPAVSFERTVKTKGRLVHVA